MQAKAATYQSESLLFGTLAQLAVIVVVACLANVGLRRLGQRGVAFRTIFARLPFAECVRASIPKGGGNTSWNYQPNWPNSPDVPDWLRVRVGPSCPKAKPVSGNEYRGGKYSRTAAVGTSHWVVVRLPAPHVNRIAYCSFLLVVPAITAVPTLGRILHEVDLTRSRLVVVTITAVAVNDVVGWILLAIISAAATSRFSFAPRQRNSAEF